MLAPKEVGHITTPSHPNVIEQCIAYLFLKMPIQRNLLARQWWCKPLIPATEKQSQVDLCEYEANLA